MPGSAAEVRFVLVLALSGLLLVPAARPQTGPQLNQEVEIGEAITNLRFASGLAWSHDGILLVSDPVRHDIYRSESGQQAKATVQDKNGVQGMTYDSESRIYYCEAEHRRVVRFDKKGAGPETVADSFEGKKLNGPNNITVRKDGQIYFTDPAFAGAVDRRELDFNGIFHVTPRGVVEAVARWATRPNGVALSPDGKILYVTDADRHALVAFDLDSKGSAANQRDLVKGIEGVPAGVCVDAAGDIMVGASGLSIYTREGALVRKLLGSDRVNNCTFGDSDLSSLFIATAKSVYRARPGVKGALQY